MDIRLCIQTLKAKLSIKTVLNTHSFDVIYLNSLYSYNFTLIPLWLLKSSNRRIVLAPRGMLGKGALKLSF